MYISFGKNKRMIHIFSFFRKKECLKEIILTTPKFSNENWLIQFGKLRGFAKMNKYIQIKLIIRIILSLYFI